MPDRTVQKRPAHRPRRVVVTPELETRIVANREQVEAGERARRERRALLEEALLAGWPQRQLAALAGVSPGTVSEVAATLREFL